MPNSVPSICNAPMACVTAPSAGGPANAADNPPFAQALDRASARQRAASGDAATDAETDPARQPVGEPAAAQMPAANARPAAGTRQPAARAAACRDAAALAAAQAIPTAESARHGELPAAQSDEDTQQGAEQEPIDLAALMSAGPMYHVAPAHTPAPPSQARQQPVRPDPAVTARTEALLRRPPAVPDTTQPPGTGSAAVQSPGASEAAVQAFAPLHEATRQEGSFESHAAVPPAPAWPAAPQRSNDTNPPLRTELQAAVGSSEFAPALGERLSVLVRDGIEHAQLKLNPADMGPIEVRISLDGNQAQVDFSAAHAGTRQALQDAVPALASALRESGLTLTGGGVFEQPRDQRGEARRDGPRGGFASAARDTAASDSRQARMPRARGVVDLYA